MLTPIDIQNRQLKQQMGGYDANETIAFLNEVIANYNELYKENQALKEKVTSLSEGIQYYKKMEGNSQIDALRAEAQAQAEVTKAKANRELEETRNHVRKLIQSYENYRLQFKKLAETQIDMVESESFSIFVPELDELMNGAPSADSVMDDPGIIPINIGSPAPFVEPPEENAPEKPASNASVVEELPVSIAIPVSSTEPFMAPPSDDGESAPSIDLNVTSSVIGSTENTNSSLEVDLGTGSAINIPISAGAFVSPDDDIPEENAFIDPAANAGVPNAETPMAPTTESPFMDIPGTSMDATTPSMDIPAAPIDATVPSMDIPITPTGEIPGAGAVANSVEPVASSIEVPIAPSSGTPMTAMDGMIPPMDPMAANSQAAGTAEASPFLDNGVAEPSAFNSAQSPFVEPAANNNPFMDVPVSQTSAPAQADSAMPAMNNAFMDIPAQTLPDNNLADNNLAANPVTDAMNNAFIDMPMQTSPDNNLAENNPVNMGIQAPNPAMPQNEFAANPAEPAMNNAFMDVPAQTLPDNNLAENNFVNMNMQATAPMNPAMPQTDFAANPAAAMNNAFVDMPMQTSPGNNMAENNPANMGMQAPNPVMPQNEFAANPFATNPAMPQTDFAANPAAANPAMQAQINPMQQTDFAANPAAAMNNNAFVDMSMPAQAPVESNPANMGMQQTDFAANPMQDNPFIEAPAADASMVDPAQAAGGMLATEPQPAAPADNNNLMADPFMDVGSMFDSPINDVPAAPEPAPAQNTQSVESFLDINPFNFIDPE